MAYQGIGTGTTPNDNNGDSLLTGAVKINSNFQEIYSALGDGSSITINSTVNSINSKVNNIYNAIGDGTNITINTITPVSSTIIDCSKGNYFTKTVSSNTIFSFSGIPSGEIYSFTIKVVHTGGTIQWPAEVRWPNNEEPFADFPGTHLFMFMTDNGGGTIRGAALVNYTA